MWLLWGRELAAGTLDTADGPAFKPLPVAVCTLLAPLGSAAPFALAAARARGRAARGGAGGACWHTTWPPRRRRRTRARRCWRGLSPPSAWPSRARCCRWPRAARWRPRSWRRRSAACWLGGPAARCVAFACGVCCALLRVEAIPFLALPALLLWRDRPALRPALAAAALAAARAVACARRPVHRRAPALGRSRPGAQPRPAGARRRARPGFARRRGGRGASCRSAWASWRCARARDRSRPLLALCGPGVAACWWPAWHSSASRASTRYALPGVAALDRGRRGGRWRASGPAARWAPMAVAALVVAAAAPRLAALPGEREELAYAARLSSDLDRAVALAGGPERLLACGHPVVGHYRGPLLAYRLGVAKRRVIFGRPHGRGLRVAAEPSAGPAPPCPPATARWSAPARGGCRQMRPAGRAARRRHARMKTARPSRVFSNPTPGRSRLGPRPCTRTSRGGSRVRCPGPPPTARRRRASR